eukprot:1189641-Prorocentrum_minimum.AAC.2
MASTVELKSKAFLAFDSGACVGLTWGAAKIRTTHTGKHHTRPSKEAPGKIGESRAEPRKGLWGVERTFVIGTGGPWSSGSLTRAQRFTPVRVSVVTLIQWFSACSPAAGFPARTSAVRAAFCSSHWRSAYSEYDANTSLRERPGFETPPRRRSASANCQGLWNAARPTMTPRTPPRATTSSTCTGRVSITARHGHCEVDRSDLIKPSHHWRIQFSHPLFAGAICRPPAS